MASKLTLEQIEERLYFFDFEVFAEDWLVVFEKFTTGEKIHFHNDSPGLVEFIEGVEDMILCAYNCKHYDYYILKGCLLGYDPFVIKEINDYIIVDKEQGWSYPFDFLSTKIPPMIDLMLDIVPMKSLKEIEGNLGLDITETSIEFDRQEKWSKKEYLEILHYCEADVEALRPLYILRKPYIQAKLDLAEMGGIDPEKVLSLTNAKLTAEFLKAQRFTPPADEKYEFPSTLGEIPEDVRNFFVIMESKFNPDGSINEEASSSYECEIAGCPHKLGFGGLHGALLNYEEENSPERMILNYDVTSYYPSLMVEYDYVSRASSEKGLYKKAYEKRVEAKNNKDKKTSEALKLVLNTAFGASINKYNKLYDPLMGKSICVSGQCFLIDLILLLNKIPSLRLIQSNTDGIMFSVDRKQYDMVKYTIKSWQKRTRFTMEEERVRKIWQRDVNNYIMVTESGDIKSKGGVFASYNNLMNSYRGYTMAIVGEAITAFFKDGTPVEDTINACPSVAKFQIIARAGSTYAGCVYFYNGEMMEAQRCNRLYATKDKACGEVKKVKLTKERSHEVTSRSKKGPKFEGTFLGMTEDGRHKYRVEREPYPFKRGYYIERTDKVANCPKHALLDNKNETTLDKIDKVWYIEHTKKEISKMKGE